MRPGEANGSSAPSATTADSDDSHMATHWEAPDVKPHVVPSVTSFLQDDSNPLVRCNVSMSPCAWAGQCSVQDTLRHTSTLWARCIGMLRP